MSYNNTKTADESNYYDVGHNREGDTTAKLWWIDDRWKMHIVDDPSQTQTHQESIGNQEFIASGRYDAVGGKPRVSLAVYRDPNLVRRQMDHRHEKVLRVLDKTFNSPTVVYDDYARSRYANCSNWYQRSKLAHTDSKLEGHIL